MFRDHLGAIREAFPTLFIEIEQSPDGDAAVDHVLAEVAGVVPTAQCVEGIVTARPILAISVCALVTGHIGIRDVPCRARQVLTRVFFFNRNPTAVQVKVGQGVVLQKAVKVVRDAERHALHSCGFQGVPFAGFCKGRKIDLVQSVTGVAILAFEGRQSTAHFLTRGVF